MKFKNTVSLKLQRALHDPSRGIKVLPAPACLRSVTLERSSLM